MRLVVIILARLTIRMRSLPKSIMVADGAVMRVMVMCADEAMSTVCDYSSVELA